MMQEINEIHMQNAYVTEFSNQNYILNQVDRKSENRAAKPNVTREGRLVLRRAFYSTDVYTNCCEILRMIAVSFWNDEELLLEVNL